NSGRNDLPNAVAEGIREEECIGAAYRHAIWSRDLSTGSRATVAAESISSSAGDCADDAIGRDFANTLIVRVANEQIAGCVYGNTLRVGDLGRGRCATIACKCTCS